MGYNTAYSLRVKVVKPVTKETHPDFLTLPDYTEHGVIAKLRKVCSYAALAITGTGECYGECKWYDHEKDLIDFSKNHPGLLFELYGFGEEHGDIWLKYFYEGKHQTANALITFEAPKII